MAGRRPPRAAKPPTTRALLAKLQDFCRNYRQTVALKHIATREEIEAAWPGGADNDDRTIWGWVRCYGSLRAMLARKHPEAVAKRQATDRQALLDAMADSPETVELVTKHADGTPRTLQVFPKGNVALVEIHQRNRVLARIIDDAELLKDAQDAATTDLYFRALDEQSYLQRLICWIATTPGPRLPYPERTPRPNLPDEWQDLTAFDFYLLAEAFLKVNVLRLAALHDSSTSRKAPDWSVFFAAVSGELGVPAATLMRDQSLASVLAESAERARAQEEATQRAKASAGAPRPEAPHGGTMRGAA